MNALGKALEAWKKLVRDTSRPLRYSDAFRDGWRAAEWQHKHQAKCEGKTS